MKLPNGYGSVYKLSGKRRNPWCARLTVGWTFDQVKGKSYPVYKFLGYYPKRQDALNALADYHRDPWDLDRCHTAGLHPHRPADQITSDK